MKMNNLKRYISLLPYFAFLGLVAFVILRAEFLYDDVWFKNVTETKTLVEFITQRYMEWSSRVGIESALFILVQHFFVWKVLTIIIYLSMFYFIVKMVMYTAKSEISLSTHSLIVLLFSVFPAPLLYGAGWTATTLNYLWPCTAFVFVVFVLFKLSIKREAIKWYLYLVTVVMALFSVNSELVCVVMPMYIALFAYHYIKDNKKVHSLIIVLSIINAAGLINALFCPGNEYRSESEAQTWFPIFPELSLFTKIEMGFSSTMHYLNAPVRVLFLFTLVCLTITVISTVKNKVLWLISIIPLAVLTVFNTVTFDNLLNPEEFMENVYLSTGTHPSLSDPSSLVVDALFVIQIVCILISLIAVFWDNKKLLACVLTTVLAGTCSRMIMSFSPTIWASGPRTFFLFFICLSVISMLLVVKLDSRNKVINRVLLATMVTMIVCKIGFYLF